MQRGPAITDRWRAHLIVGAVAVAAGYGVWSLGHRAGVASRPGDTEGADATPSASELGDGAAVEGADASAVGLPAAPSAQQALGNADADEAGPPAALGLAAAPTGSGAAPLEAEGPAAPPLQIDVEPAALRVWHNTLMRFQVLPRPGEAARWQRFVWHFEDGSQPVAGDSVLHMFAESVTDRHISLEAFERSGARIVVSKRLPIERLSVTPVDGPAPTEQALPKARAGRLLLVGQGQAPQLAPLFAAVADAGVVAVVAVGAADWAEVVRGAAERGLPNAAVLAMDDAVDAPGGGPEGVPAGVAAGGGKAAGAAPGRSPLVRVLRAAEGAVATLPDSQALVIADIAIVPFDSRPWTVTEPALAALRRDLRLAAAWPALVVLGPRPLAALIDGEAVADRAYRVYEHALRERAVAMVSTASGVAYDGRYGGLAAVGVGKIRPDGCARLAGSDRCQLGTATLLEVHEGGARAFHLRGPDFAGWLDSDDLPTSVGRYRRDLRPAGR